MSHPTRQRGITLIEIILWSAIVAAAAVALFVFAGRARVAAAVETEQRQVEQLVRTVDGLFQLQPNFAALGTNGAAYLDLRGAERSGLKFTRTEHGVLTLATGVGNGELNLAVWDVEQPSGPAIRSGGYRLAYPGLSAAECVGLASALGKSAHQVRVGVSGLDDGAAGLVAHRYDRGSGPDQLAELCSRDGRVVFVYFAPARAITASVPGAGAVAPRCRPQRETTYAVCPPGQMGAITQVRDGTCTGVDNGVVWTAWSTIDSTCQPEPAIPPQQTPTAPPDTCTSITTRRMVACPAGQTGHIVEESTQDTCAGTQTPWTQVPGPAGNTCRAPETPCTMSAEGPVPFACPAGQGGQILRTRYSTCSAPTGVAPQWPAWSDAHTISNTCTTACSHGGSSCCTPIPETRVVECPAGSYGPGTPQIRFRGCVNATTQSGSWSAWQPYRDLEGNPTCDTCPTHVLTETQTQWVERSEPCPAGQTGKITWEAEQVRTRDIATQCPAGTTALPAPTVGDWSDWADTGARRTMVNTCAPSSGCLEMTDRYGGVMDTHDAYYTIAYVANGVSGGCYASRRDDGLTGFDDCRGGANGVLDLAEWSRVANVGETYVTNGSQSGWGGSAHEFWGWDYEEFTLINDSCKPTPPTGCRWDVQQTLSAPNWGNLDGGSIEYEDGVGGGCSAGWGIPGGGVRATFDACKASIPSTPPRPSARYRESEFSNWGGIAENAWEATASSACVEPPATSCSIPAGTVFNWTVAGNACTFTQGTATTVASGGAFTANDTIAPTTGSANFTCSPGGHTVDPSTYSSGLDTNCDPPSPRWPDTDQDGAVNRFCASAGAGSSGTVSWCPSPQVEASIHVVCGSAAPTMATTPNAGATCSTACVVPSPSTETNTETRAATQAVPCPAGETGLHTQSRNEVRTQTRTASCPTPSGSVVWSGWSAWSGWTGTSAWITTSNTCAPATYNGQCSQISRPTSWGCGEYRLVSGAWVPTPGSVTIDDSLNGGWFGNSLQGTRCVYGYTDVLDANGYPTPLTAADRAKIVYDYTTPAPNDLDVFYQNGSDGSWVGNVAYSHVYARNSAPNPIRGDRCAWTKWEFMNN